MILWEDMSCCIGWNTKVLGRGHGKVKQGRGKKCWEQAQSISLPSVQPAGSQCGRPQSSDEGAAEEAGLFLRLWDLDSMTAPLWRVALLERQQITTGRFCELEKIYTDMFTLTFYFFFFLMKLQLHTNFVSIFDLMSLARVRNACKQGHESHSRNMITLASSAELLSKTATYIFNIDVCFCTGFHELYPILQCKLDRNEWMGKNTYKRFTI